MKIYLHTAKTAGTTMLHYLENQCETFHAKSWWRMDWQTVPTSTECLFSHCPYGVPDRYIPGEHQYMTYLRDPVDRMISYYYFGLQAMRGPQQIGLALGNFINIMQSNLFATLDNGMVRIVAGRMDMGMAQPMEMVTEADLEKAKENLSTFAALGIVDTFDEDLAKIAKKFGWESTEYERYRTGRRPPLEDVDKKMVAMIMENNKLDRQLYDFAKEIKDEINE